MLKKYLTDALWYSLSSILSKSILIFLLPLITNYYSPYQLGIIETVLILGGVLPAFFSLEISQGFARNYPEMIYEKDKPRLISNTLVFVVLTNLLLFFLFIIFKNIILEYIGVESDGYLLILLISLSLFFSYLFIVSVEQLRWMMKSKQYAICNLIYTLLFASILLFSLEKFGSKIENYFISQIFASFISFVFVIIFLKKNILISIDFFVLRKLLNYSAPLIFSTLALNISLYIDRIFIKQFMGNLELGIVAVAMRISAVISVLTAVFQGPLMPIIYKEHGSENGKKTIEKILNIYLFVFCIILLNLILFSDNIVNLLANRDYKVAAIILPLISIKLFFTQTYVFSPGLAISKKTKQLALLFLCYLLLNLLTFPIYIQYKDIFLFAIGTCFNSFVFFISYYFLSSRYYKLHFNLLRIFYLFLYIIALIYISNKYIYSFERNYTNLFFKIMVSLFSSIFLIKVLFKKNDVFYYKIKIIEFLKLKD